MARDSPFAVTGLGHGLALPCGMILSLQHWHRCERRLHLSLTIIGVHLLRANGCSQVHQDKSSCFRDRAVWRSAFCTVPETSSRCCVVIVNSSVPGIKHSPHRKHNSLQPNVLWGAARAVHSPV